VYLSAHSAYEKAVIEVYSENSKLKKKVDEMAKLIKEQNAKLYDHTRREKDLLAENEQLRSEIARLKDEKMVLARGHVPNQSSQPVQREQKEEKRKATQPGQNEDFDFWSMPQNEYGKKKKDFVQDSNLWVNQKEHEGVFLTEEQPTVSKKKK
jgi:septal ring factor EnvC (AmiA/AmiB activator)